MAETGPETALCDRVGDPLLVEVHVAERGRSRPNHLDQREVAGLANTARTVVIALEAGDTGVSLRKAMAICEVLGLRIAAPFVAMNFLVMLSFAALTRAVPKINVFILSYSARVFAGIALLTGAGTLFARYLAIEFGNMPSTVLEVLPMR